MKTCKNCGTENQVHQVKCISCNMENLFTLHAAVIEEVIEPEKKEIIQCLNCGDRQSVLETHCTACRFPLAEVKVKTIDALSAKLGKAI